MIRGAVDADFCARVRLRIRGPNGADLDIDTLIDTGFDDSLILPATIIGALGLTMSSTGQALLADGSTKHFDVYSADLDWDGVWRSIQVSAVGVESLLGMALLAEHELLINVVPGGKVEITSSP